uniref:Zinc finger protein 786 n=1 Tax=Nannospalax galili TaxID=1026970 RepID=A0A8C6S252_NANGA
VAGPGRLPLTFEDVAIYFSEKEWQNLETWQKELYKHVMRTNYETLVSVDGGLPKPELISWIECGREPFSSWEGEQKLGKEIHPDNDDVHFVSLWIFKQLFEGCQETVESGEIKCHFQLDPLQSQNSFRLVLGERETATFRHDQALSLVTIQTHSIGALAAVVHSFSESAQREGISGHSSLHSPGLQDVPSLQSTQHSCLVYGENSWKKNHLMKHQKAGAKNSSPSPEVAGTQTHFPCPECGRGFCQKQYLMRHLNAHTKKSPSQCPECKMCFHHEQTRVSCHFKHSPPQNLNYDKSFFPKDSINAHECQESGGRPASWREDTTVDSGQTPGPSLGCVDCLLQESRVEAPQCSCSHGGDRPCACTESNNCTSSGSKLTSLCRAHEGEKPFQCPEYNKRLCLRGRQNVHQRVHSAERSLTSRKCDPGLTKPCRLTEHTRIPSGEKLFWCAECGKNCPYQRGQLLRHQRLHQEEKAFQGALRESNFGLRSALRVHQLQHVGEKRFSCSECGRAFSHQCKLREHLRVHSGERPFQCSECHKSFRLKGVLKTHQHVHSNERPFSCAECGKGFTRQSNLTDHLRVHSGERPFQCPECDRRFRLKAQLLIHQRLHTGERPYQCPECGKSYRMRAVMKAHQQLHSGQMPFSCECGKGFAKHSKLVEHRRMHTGEKPFQCPKCDKSFRLKPQLLSHQGLHTGERPFHCPECDKNFRERSHMVRHQRIHRPERPFVCGDCGKGFIYKSKLAEHIRVHRKSCPPKPDIKQRLSQLFAMIEADWS